VRKPLDIDLFLAAISRILTVDLPLPILVVEDNDDLRNGLEMILEFEGYLVATSENGQLALEAIAADRYAVILLDLWMPIVNGFEFLTAYADQQIVHSPVIIVSADNSIAAETLPAFVVNTIPKPYDLMELLALINVYAQKIPLAL
jgi:DNA-binding NtrC family response regulator